jgi:hypothetical protein
MRVSLILSIILISLTGCATSFTSFSNLESIGDAEIKNEDLKVSVGIQPLGDNGRFKDKAEDMNITILKLRVNNISTDTISIKNSNIYLRGIANNEPISQIAAEDVADRMSLATGAYWLWGLLWFGSTTVENGESSSLWLPVGLPIGAFNFFRAKNTNRSFKDEVTKQSFSDSMILPKMVSSGMLFFNRSGGKRYNLVVEYDKNGIKKEISLPYKF